METNVYIVQPGDSLWKIARRFGTTVEELTRFNGIENPDHISPGQAIRLPRGQETDSSFYIVQEGDSLWKIARRFDTTVEELARLNSIENPDRIFPGQAIRLPGGQETEIPIYIVQEGDSLWKIARRYDTTVEELAALNDLPDPEQIQPGQVLRLSRTASALQGDFYTMGENETLGDVARRLGTTAGRLMNQNGISDPDHLPAGTSLFSETLRG